MTKSRALVLLVLLLLTAACRGCYTPDRSVSRDVTEAEIVGVWELTAESLALLRPDGYEPDAAQTHRITIRENGELAFASVVDGFGGPKHVETAGTWKLAPDRGDADDAPANTLHMELDTPEMRTLDHLGITEEDGKLRLWAFHDDPDLWQFLEYVRAE